MDKQRFDIIIGMQTGEITKGVKSANGDLKALKRAFKDTLSALPGGENITKELKAARAQVEALIKDIERLQQKGAAKGKTNIGQFTPRQKADLYAGIEQTKGAIKGAVPGNIAMQEAKALAALQSKAITLRYALYDVGSAATNASQALLGYAGAVLDATAAQQQAFAQIEKTQVGNKNATEELKKLKDELITLSTTIPVSFTELSKIGMLGAQMGVAAKDIARFTEVTAKFSALTGISAEDAAQSIGKVAGILGIGADQYAALGSAIVGVGFASKATEAQIISTAGQIGAIAKQAGLANTEVIGLSSAMASLKIAPEEARGVIQPTFAAIGTATRSYNSELKTGSELLATFTELAKSGATEIAALGDKSGYSREKLAMFTELSKGSAEEFVRLWGDKTSGGAGAVFQAFITGLGNSDIGDALVKIGLDGVRTSKGLTAMGMRAEEVGKQMQIALTEGTKGTLLDEASAGIIDNIASKLTMLQSSIEAVMAAAGSNPAVLGLLGNMLDFAIQLNKAFADVLAGSGFAGALAGITVLIAGIAGVLLSLVATAALAAGGFLALKTAMAAAKAEGIVFNAGLKGLAASIWALVPASRTAATSFNTIEAGAIGASVGTRILATSLRVLKYALVSTLVGGVVVVLGELIANMMEAADKSKTQGKALNAVGEGAIAATEDLRPLKEELQNLLDALQDYPKAVTGFENSMYALGQAVQTNGKYFGDTTKAGRDNLGAFRNVLQAMFDASKGSADIYGSNLVRFRDHLASIGMLSAQMRDEINGLLTGMSWTKTTEGALNGIDSLNSGLVEIKGSAGQAKTALEKLDEIIQKIFRPVEAKLGLQDAFDALGESIAKNGKSFGYSTKGMRENLKALQDVISAFKTSSNGNLKIFATNLVDLRASLGKLGITGGTAIKLIDNALKTIKTKGKTNAKEIAAIYSAISNALVSEQAKNIRTISDYVNDLTGVLDQAFSNRYGKQSARDSITTMFINMQEAADAAKKSIDDAKIAIDGLKADKAVLEYQLKVAIKYGDALRAQSIQAKLAEINKNVAEEQTKISEAQALQNRTLTGNSKAAIENRAKVRDLVQAGNAYLMTLAQTGMSSADLKTEANKLAEEFLTQGENLGFAKSELEIYTNYFKSDFTTVIDGLPRDITLTVNTDPALAAVQEFVAKANQALSQISIPEFPSDIVTGGGTSGGATGGTKAPSAGASKLAAAQGTKALVKSATDKLYVAQRTLGNLQSSYANLTSKLKSTPMYVPLPGMTSVSMTNPAYVALQTSIAANKSSQAKTNTSISALKSTLRAVKKASGGYISGAGTSRSDSIPAMLSNGEYVLQANAVKYYGTDFMNALNQMQVQRPSSQAASGNVVYLSPEDRQLLRAAADRPIALYTENTKIAQSANAGNVVLAQRGTK